MVIPVYRFGTLPIALTAVLFLCQCETKRTVKSTRSSISFDERMWGGQGGGADEGKIRSKFADKGYSIGDDGKIKADKPNLYADEKAKGLDGKFGKKQARFKNSEARTKEFRTPEYLKRQQFRGADAARESGSQARESNFGNSRDRQANKLFGKKSQSTSELTSFATSTDSATNKSFSTGADRAGSEAISSAPVARGRQQTMGYQDNASLTLDDVKKMVSPGSYARQKKLD